tara:strand:- start:72180 stop:72614 length:435 start_codon:yes stop_codon:yes gene_type:complete
MMKKKTIALIVMMLSSGVIGCKDSDSVKRTQDKKQILSLKARASQLGEWLSTYASISEFKPASLVTDEIELEHHLDSILKANIPYDEYTSIKIDILSSSNMLRVSKTGIVDTYFICNRDTLTMLETGQYQVLKTTATQSSTISF